MYVNFEESTILLCPWNAARSIHTPTIPVFYRELCYHFPPANKCSDLSLYHYTESHHYTRNVTLSILISLYICMAYATVHSYPHFLGCCGALVYSKNVKSIPFRYQFPGCTFSYIFSIIFILIEIFTGLLFH